MAITSDEIRAQLSSNFPFTPTQDQNVALGKVAEFLSDNRTDTAMILQGYAGTGKTSLIRSFVKTLPSLDIQVVLLAPTGRAAKVMAHYAQTRAFTIHKAIYIPQRLPGGGMAFTIRPNRASNTLFVVDEASMISDSTLDARMTGGSLLEDLLRFVSMGKGNKLMFIGDTAQLPPVHYDTSPALNPTVLAGYGRDVYFTELRQVMRQSEESGVLRNATYLRELQKEHNPKVLLQENADVHRLYDGYMIEEALNKANDEGVDEVVVVTRSNKRANLYNRQIRSRVHWREDRVATGDYLMIVKNNYFWLPNSHKAGFLANGDVVEVLQIRNEMSIHGFTFVDVTLRLPDYPDEEPFESKLMLDVLDLEGPSLDREMSNQLYEGVQADYSDIPSKSKRMEQVKNDPFLNALQVKFSYAVTGHKAQGGQWNHVFIEHPWTPDGTIDLEYLRWLYTAFTRSKSQVYLLGFPNEFFPTQNP
ncbi:ATP-dependent DNA helicase [Phaeocystidibacter luteus]|uniref:AAA family ATPase n=1 Tax=Phaeocystidibacter luteus TaxID=911197 RepID=A0A6N6RJT3_9FLAO|nr:AAA family ATPase [Phaeocystidibacter luteus]KAB2808048.1 AAA family ATPase [Phaeocystidibacter luteus]